MAKETEEPTESLFNNRWLLFILATIFGVCAYWFRQWPVFSLVALIPCFALTDHPKSSNVWGISEFLLFSFGISLYVGFHFDLSQIFTVVAMAAVFTLPFILFVISRLGGGPLTGHFLIIIYWLALEYITLKILVLFNLFPQSNPVFLADFFLGREEWLKWNGHTGYLSISAWILISNWLGYRTIKGGAARWINLTLFIFVIAVPIAFSYWTDLLPITRNEMFSLYSTDKSVFENYSLQGEWMARTCAWVSVLVLLFSFVRYRTKKK